MAVTQEPSVGDIQCFCISNGSGVELRCISLGATITQLKLADGVDVVLGFKDLNDYRTNSPYIGSSVGRVANRIREATFSLDGQTYTVSRNVSPHTLHGGETGFNKANWAVSSTTENSVTFKHVSVSGDMGYPGTLEATATYTLADSGEVGVAYTATADQPTIVNLVNHTYFNLTQEDTILGHILTIDAPRYTPLDDELIAIGMLEAVAGTPLDFTTPTPIGLRLDQVEGGGYDINYNIQESRQCHPTNPNLRLNAVVEVQDHKLKVYSDQPGLQLYTGNFLDGSYTGKDGKPIVKHGGLCLETQAWPNAVNNPQASDQVILKPGNTYRSKTVWVLQ